nr:HAD-IA family hydrolase [uncultured Albidiferax sp.]
MNINDQMQSVVFDVDGTLLDTLPSLAGAANEVLQLAGLRTVEPEALRSALSEGLAALFQCALELQPEAVSDALAQRLEAAFLDQYATQWLREATVFEGVREVLAMLRSLGLSLGICTNRDRASTEALLEGAALRGFFDTLVGVGDSAHAKPDAAPLQLVMQRLGATPSATLFVGDSGIDAACADAAGVRLAAHLCGYSGSAEDLYPRAMAFSAYTELGGWIKERVTVLVETASHG